MSDLVFYTNPMSRGRVVRWMLEELGAPYETVLLDYGADMKAPGYLAINPMGKVPAIRQGDQVVTEVAAICTYLAEAFPEAGLAPRPEERADYLRWMFFFAGPVEYAVTNRASGVDTENAERARGYGYGTMTAVLDTLEGLFAARDYICGGRFTAADVFAGSALQWGLSFGTLPERPGFRAYADRLAARPAAMRARAIDDALTEPAKA